MCLLTQYLVSVGTTRIVLFTFWCTPSSVWVHCVLRVFYRSEQLLFEYYLSVSYSFIVINTLRVSCPPNLGSYTDLNPEFLSLTVYYRNFSSFDMVFIDFVFLFFTLFCTLLVPPALRSDLTLRLTLSVSTHLRA